MKNWVFLILALPVMGFSGTASAQLQRLPSFGFQPSPLDENRVQVTGWDRIPSAPGSSYSAYRRDSKQTTGKEQASDGMSIYTWDTKSETSLAPKTVIITTVFTAADEKLKSRREIYIYDYTKTLDLEAVSYCSPGLAACSSVNAKSCAQNKVADPALAQGHSHMLASHFVGIGVSTPAGLTEKFEASSADLVKPLCTQFFKAALKKAPAVKESKKDSQPGKN